VRARRAVSKRLLILIAIVVAAVVGGTVSVVSAIRQAHSSHPPAGVTVVEGAASLAGIDAPQLLFRNTIPDKTFGRVAMAPLADPDGHRTITPLTCDRVYYAHGSGLCLKAAGAFTNSYQAQIFDASFAVRKTFKIPGIPSRARITADGRFGAITTFVNGDSYAPGNFSTRTSIVDLRTGRSLGNLEQFTVLRDGEVFKRQNFNFWGVTFASDDHIYATLGSGSDTFLVGGSIRARTLRVITTHLECPSVSPDGTRIAFKQSINSHGSWRLYVLDLKTLKRHPLAETGSVDDQVEWLDDDTVLYWRGTDIWKVPADGSGTPVRFVRRASSPTVVRPG
jgi:hypothetical protein